MNYMSSSIFINTLPFRTPATLLAFSKWGWHDVVGVEEVPMIFSWVLFEQHRRFPFRSPATLLAFSKWGWHDVVGVEEVPMIFSWVLFEQHRRFPFRSGLDVFLVLHPWNDERVVLANLWMPSPSSENFAWSPWSEWVWQSTRRGPRPRHPLNNP